MNGIKNYVLTIILILPLISCGSKAQPAGEKQWQSLFNGENLDDWVVKIHHHDVGENYANTFRVVDGVIQVNYDGYDKFDERYGHLFYKEPFSSFHLKFEYRFRDEWLEDAPGYTYRNSGVMFHSQDPHSILKEQDWPISVEYQMLAEGNGSGSGVTGNMCSPGTEVFFNGEMDPRHCIDSSMEAYPWDEWVEADLIVYEDSLVIHKVNGEQVLEYTKPQIGGGVANGFDPEVKVDGKALREGYIGLQSEGQGVEFRNIKIRELE